MLLPLEYRLSETLSRHSYPSCFLFCNRLKLSKSLWLYCQEFSLINKHWSIIMLFTICMALYHFNILIFIKQIKKQVIILRKEGSILKFNFLSKLCHTDKVNRLWPLHCHWKVWDSVNVNVLHLHNQVTYNILTTAFTTTSLNTEPWSFLIRLCHNNWRFHQNM